MFGSLEKKILSVLYREKRATARDIFHSIEQGGIPTTYVSVNTVLSRLHKKGLVNRTKVQYRGTFRYFYDYVDVRDAFISLLIDDVDTIFGNEGLDHLKERLEGLDATIEEEDTQSYDYGAPRLTPERIARMYMPLTREPMNLNEAQRQVGLVRIIIERCKGCGYCWVYCPVDVLEESRNINSRGYHYPSLKDGMEESCVGCGMCTEICPDLAIFSEEVVNEDIQTNSKGESEAQQNHENTSQEAQT